MKRKNTQVTDELENFLKKFAKLKNMSEGDIFRLALTELKNKHKM